MGGNTKPTNKTIMKEIGLALIRILPTIIGLFKKKKKQEKEVIKQIDKFAELEGEELVQMERVDGTPFTIVKDKDGWNVTVGKYRVNTPFETKQEAIWDAQTMNWDKIMQMITIFIEANNTKLNNEQNGE